MSAGDSQAPSVIKSCRDGGIETSPLLAAGAGTKNMDPACAGPRVLLILVDLSRAPLCVDSQFWRFQRSNVIKYVGNSLLVFSCCAVTPGCSDFVRFLFFSADCRSSPVSLPMFFGADFASGLPKEGWIPADSAEPEVLGLLPARLSCLSEGLSTFWSLSPKAFVLSSALGISPF
jgi:hypothetical protein